MSANEDGKTEKEGSEFHHDGVLASGVKFARLHRMITACSILKRRAGFGASLILAAGMVCSGLAQGHATETGYVATLVGAPLIVFDPRRDACDGHDVPDAPLRAYRDAEGRISAFALHYENRRMRGSSLLTLKPDCSIVFRGTGNSDPKAYDDRSWIAATWTANGRHIHALAHHEFQAHGHKGRCAYAEYIKCWWNSILSLKSDDSGARFTKLDPLVMAATPFPSERGQGRHRGFFNPSNIVERNGAHFALIATTGWEGQPSGACLFRSEAIASGEWRAYDGKGFSARFGDPYREGAGKNPHCAVLPPFPAPIGGLARLRGKNIYLAVYQAQKGMPDGFGGNYPVSGFYLAASRDLLRWERPSLVHETATLYDPPCGTGVQRSYPVLIDEKSESRNFEDIGEEALLFYTEMRIDGCTQTSDRKLIARKVRISTFERE
jgi:hypothetical protein